jgi:hypothetical protein
MPSLSVLSLQYKPREKAKLIGTICFRKAAKYGSSRSILPEFPATLRSIIKGLLVAAH